MLKYWVWLAELPGLRSQPRLALLRHFGSPENIFFADREELLLAEDVPPAQAELALNRDLSAADRILADCQRLGQRILTLQDGSIPSACGTSSTRPWCCMSGVGCPPLTRRRPLPWWAPGSARPTASPARSG